MRGLSAVILTVWDFSISTDVCASVKKMVKVVLLVVFKLRNV